MEHSELLRSTTMMQSIGKSTHIRMSQILGKRGEEELFGRRTKIICTMGPSCWDVDVLVKMLDAGMNVCRLNFSHGDHETHEKTVKNILEAQKLRSNNTIAILLDTKGPEIRTGKLVDGKPVQLSAGQRLAITTDYSFVGDNTMIACSYAKLPQSVSPGQIILMADGSLSCKVQECFDDHIVAIVMNNAKLGERKNMNLPGVKVDLDCVSAKDRNDIENFAIPMGVNYIALSFVQSAEDIRITREILGLRGRHIKIIPKIENVESLLNFDEILKEADGVMIARGDLGMEIPPEKVFLAQKMMISKCNVAGKFVITATQMLESMTTNPRPTRAEAADVANAVLDGTDCVMLSGETANGHFPVDAVTVMAKVCLEAEACIDYPHLFSSMLTAVPAPISTQEAVARAAVHTADSTRATLIVVLTETGYTARLIAKYRPHQQILALSASDRVIAHMQAHRGVITLLVPSFHGTDQVIRNALAVALERRWVSRGDSVVAVHGMKEEVAGSSNLMKVLEIE